MKYRNHCPSNWKLSRKSVFFSPFLLMAVWFLRTDFFVISVNFDLGFSKTIRSIWYDVQWGQVQGLEPGLQQRPAMLRLGKEWLEKGVSWQLAGEEPAACPSGKKANRSLGFIRNIVASSGRVMIVPLYIILCSVLVPSLQEGYGSAGSCPEKQWSWWKV